jgi:hypothetical protein
MQVKVYLSGGLSNVEGWCKTVCESTISTTHLVFRSISFKKIKIKLSLIFHGQHSKLNYITSPVERPNPNSNLNFVIRHCFDKYLYS